MATFMLESQVWNDTGIQFFDPGDPNINFLFPVYEFSPNTYSATFIVKVLDPISTEGALIPATISNIRYTGDSGFIVTQDDESSFTVSGVWKSAFSDEIFRFLMPDLKTIKDLPRDTKEEFAALIRWQPPPVKVKSMQHSFTVFVEEEEEDAEYTISQDVHWKYEPSLVAFQQLLARGTI